MISYKLNQFTFFCVWLLLIFHTFFFFRKLYLRGRQWVRECSQVLLYSWNACSHQKPAKPNPRLETWSRLPTQMSETQFLGLSETPPQVCIGRIVELGTSTLIWSVKLNTHPWNAIHSHCSICSLLLVIIKWYSIGWIYHNLFVHSFIDGRWASFQFGTILNTVTMVIFIQISFGYMFWFLFLWLNSLKWKLWATWYTYFQDPTKFST